MPGRLQGKVAIVTGAGQGIGEAVARSFAGSFWAWLEHAAAEFGYEVATVQG